MKHYAMKAYGGVDVHIHIFLTSALAGGEWSASRPCRFTPCERAPGIHWIGGWVSPRPGLDEVEKRKFLILTGLEILPLGRPARSQSPYRLRRLSWLLANKQLNKIYKSLYCKGSVYEGLCRPMSVQGNYLFWLCKSTKSCRPCYMMRFSLTTIVSIRPLVITFSDVWSCHSTFKGPIIPLKELQYPIVVSSPILIIKWDTDIWVSECQVSI
jgi:hypothetical protein